MNYKVELTRRKEVEVLDFNTYDEAQEAFGRGLDLFKGKGRKFFVSMWATIYDTDGNEVAWTLVDTSKGISL